MRVGVIGPISPDSFADNICDCLPDLGVEVIPLGPARPALPGRLDPALDLVSRAEPAFDAWLQRPLVRRIAEAECDLVIAVIGMLLPKTVAAIRAQGVRTALWFPDAILTLDRQLMLIADYDRLYFKDMVLVQRLQAQTTLPVAYLPEACNPHWHVPTGEAAVTPEIAVVGNMYPSRIRVLDRLHAAGIPLRLYGSGFPRWMPTRPVMSRHTGRVVTREAKALVFRGAAGVLNNLHPGELGSVNCRLFEAAGCGGAVICEERPILHEHFEVNQEVLGFATYAELEEHCVRLLADAKFANELGNAAAKRAGRDHTYQRRLQDILQDCAP